MSDAADSATDAQTTSDADVRAMVQEFYGETVACCDDLKTDACRTSEAPPPALRARLANLHDATLSRYFGCGLIAPEALTGRRVLDLGCGAGRDVYVLSQMVGPHGFVDGVDMTEAQLDAARERLDWHMERFGYATPNVAFHDGLLERLEETPIRPGSVDVAVSNCVINLVADKAAALAGVHRLLKPGGEFYFSDVYADRRLPAALRADPRLYGECLGGALYWRDFLEIAQQVGFAAPRLVTESPMGATDGALADALGEARFVSATFRLFKLTDGPAAREDYGQHATYRGGLEGAEDALRFDVDLTLPAGVATPVDAAAARMLTESRFADHVAVTAPGAHRGAFSAAPRLFDPRRMAETAPASACCG